LGFGFSIRDPQSEIRNSEEGRFVNRLFKVQRQRLMMGFRRNIYIRDGARPSPRVPALIWLIISMGLVVMVNGQTEMKRNRGETFYRCLSSNTEGSGNIWLDLSAIGHVWDDSPIRLKQAGVQRTGFWVSNARAFPEIRLQGGLFDFAMLSLESRPITYAAVIPGWVSADAKLTWPNNKTLRFMGAGLDLKFQYNTTNGPPTLGGYIGFMPEGYVAKGSVFEAKALFDIDFMARTSFLPFRALVNAGIRLPLGPAYAHNYQFLGDVAVVYSAYDFDCFAAYSLEAFDNFAEPKVFDQGDKKFLVWFQENPMYLIPGGDFRYKNGVTISVALPLLLSANKESKMSVTDLEALHRDSPENRARFPYEMSHGIKDPFDPWFVKWKVVASIAIPLRFKLTSAEMMRNFLLLKNTKRQERLDIDNRLRNFEESPSPEPQDESKDLENRLQEIEKRKEELKKEE
jgi:hypothetical protein